MQAKKDEGKEAVPGSGKKESVGDGDAEGCRREAGSRCCARVSFLPAVVGTDKEKMLRFIASPSVAGFITIPVSGFRTVVGAYDVEPTTTTPKPK